jgi:hypothetical protein
MEIVHPLFQHHPIIQDALVFAMFLGSAVFGAAFVTHDLFDSKKDEAERKKDEE